MLGLNSLQKKNGSNWPTVTNHDTKQYGLDKKKKNNNNNKNNKNNSYVCDSILFG